MQLEQCERCGKNLKPNQRFCDCGEPSAFIRSYVERRAAENGSSFDIELQRAHVLEGSRFAAGNLEGKHYTEYVDQVKALKRNGENDMAIRLLCELVQKVEDEASIMKWGVAPWYYEQLAILHRKQGDKQAEIAILQHYMEVQTDTPTRHVSLHVRLAKLLANSE